LIKATIKGWSYCGKCFICVAAAGSGFMGTLGVLRMIKDKEKVERLEA
jgi:hypothetical protein